jgi:hypothetical protein
MIEGFPEDCAPQKLLRRGHHWTQTDITKRRKVAADYLRYWTMQDKLLSQPPDDRGK